MKLTWCGYPQVAQVVWSEEDGEFVGLCVELPSISWLAATQEAALQGVQKAVREVLEDIKSPHGA